jgi:hypothetical protein
MTSSEGSNATFSGPPLHTAGKTITTAQVVLILGLTTLVLMFTAWMITQHYSPYVGLLTASGGVAVASGLAYVPRGLKRLAQLVVQS